MFLVFVSIFPPSFSQSRSSSLYRGNRIGPDHQRRLAAVVRDLPRAHDYGELGVCRNLFATVPPLHAGYPVVRLFQTIGLIRVIPLSGRNCPARSLWWLILLTTAFNGGNLVYALGVNVVSGR